MFVRFNANPQKNTVGDCVIRAISKALNKPWEEVYIDLVWLGLEMRDLPNANEVWGTYLMEKGFERFNVPAECPACFTVADFCDRYNDGVYVVGSGNHAVCCAFGKYFDTWDSGGESPLFAYKRR